MMHCKQFNFITNSKKATNYMLSLLSNRIILICKYLSKYFLRATRHNEPSAESWIGGENPVLSGTNKYLHKIYSKRFSLLPRGKPIPKNEPKRTLG